MNPQTTPQPLTTEELDALLFRSTDARLAPAQSAELDSLRSVLSDLRMASAAAAGDHHRHASLAPARSRTTRVLWTFATAALFFCVALPMFFRHHPTPVQVAVIAAKQPAPVVSDDVLLADVQADLDASVPSPMLPLTTTDTTTKSTTQRTR